MMKYGSDLQIGSWLFRFFALWILMLRIACSGQDSYFESQILLSVFSPSSLWHIFSISTTSSNFSIISRFSLLCCLPSSVIWITVSSFIMSSIISVLVPEVSAGLVSVTVIFIWESPVFNFPSDSLEVSIMSSSSESIDPMYISSSIHSSVTSAMGILMPTTLGSVMLVFFNMPGFWYSALSVNFSLLYFSSLCEFVLSILSSFIICWK